MKLILEYVVHTCLFINNPLLSYPIIRMCLATRLFSEIDSEDEILSTVNHFDAVIWCQFEIISLLYYVLICIDVMIQQETVIMNHSKFSIKLESCMSLPPLRCGCVLRYPPVVWLKKIRGIEVRSIRCIFFQKIFI